MIRRSLLIILLINTIRGQIRIGKNFLGNYCYGAEYTVVVTGEVFCNKIPYNNSKIFINECDESGAVCKNVSDVRLIGNTFNHSAKFVNKRNVDFYLIIKIYHKCCDSPFKTRNYEKQFKNDLQDYNFQCGPYLKNIKDYEKIDLPIGGSECYCENYTILIRGTVFCRKAPLPGTKVDIMLCNTYGAFCVTVETITLSSNELTYSKTIKNERKSESILKIDINHNCCSQKRGNTFFPNIKSLFPFGYSNLKCGNVKNTKHFETIDLKNEHCSSKTFMGPFGKK